MRLSSIAHSLDTAKTFRYSQRVRAVWKSIPPLLYSGIVRIDAILVFSV